MISITGLNFETLNLAMEPASGGRYPSGVVALNKGVQIHKSTLKIEPDQQDPDKYLVEFTYDAYVAGRIILCFGCTKLGDKGVTKYDLNSLVMVDAPKGHGQKFRQAIDLSSYKAANVSEVYKLAIQAVGSMKDGTTACHYSEARFNKVEEIRITFQCLHLNGVQYVLHYTNVIDNTDGRLLFFGKEIGKGRNGTVVFEGIFEGRAVAVKKIQKMHMDVAWKEIEYLISSGQHSNIVRYYGVVDCDQDFVYLALELCVCSLDSLISPYGDSTMEVFKDLELWKPNHHPSPLLLRLLRETVAGLAHLHKLGIIHGCLKPQNVLIGKDTLITAKVSDMGISKLLLADKSSFTKTPTGIRERRGADLFSLGILLFFCITRGRHPFGDEVCERDINIKKNVKRNLELVNHLPEAHDLIYRLLHPNPKSRPTAEEVYEHPLFWDWWTHASERVDLESHTRTITPALLKLENHHNHYRHEAI